MDDRHRIIEQSMEKLHEIGHAVSAAFRELAMQESITFSQMIILHTIETKPGISIKELSAIISTTSSAATQQVDILVNKGCIIRENDPNDRRSLNLYLSPSMEMRAKTLRTEYMSKLSEYFSILTDKELAEFSRICSKVANNVSGKR